MSLVIVTHTEPLSLQLEAIEHEEAPPGQAAVAYTLHGSPVARGVIAEDALPALRSLLDNPVLVALAAKEDDGGNIDGRVCLVLPVGDEARREEEEPEDEPWRSSVPAPAFETGSADREDPENDLALLPIGNVVRSAANRNHPNLADDAREMLANLLAGRAKDAVAKAIDDLLGSL